MNFRKFGIVLFPVLLIGCAPPESPVEADVVKTADIDSIEQQVQEYIQTFPYQDTYTYTVKYTGDDPANLNVWVLGQKPVLVKAGELGIQAMVMHEEVMLSLQRV